MTVPANLNRVDYTGTGTTGPFTIPFPFYDTSHLTVLQTDALFNQTTLTGWTATGAGGPSGAVTLAAACPVGSTLTIMRLVPLTQITSIKNQEAFYPEVHEQEMDLLAMADQQLDEAMDRTLRLPAGLSGVDMTLPRPDPGHSLVWNAAGDGLENAGVASATLQQDLADSADVAKGDDMIAVLQPFAGAVARTQHDKNAEWVSVLDFGADPTGVFDSSDAIQAAINSLPSQDIYPMSPKTQPNGGRIFIPKGRYRVDKTINLVRGIYLEGESREGSQLWSYCDKAVLKYIDVGAYTQDEIVVKNLAIYQDSTVVPTSGAAIMIDGGVNGSMYINFDNLIIEGTYCGLWLFANVGCSVSNCNISKCVQHGIYVVSKRAITSTVFQNNYTHICGGSGVRFESKGSGSTASYISFIGCASDSNTLYGYEISESLCVNMSGCGAEWNNKSGYLFRACQGVDANIYTLYCQEHGVEINYCDNVVLTGSHFNSDVGGYGVYVSLAKGPIVINGCTFLGVYDGNECNSIYKVINTTAPGFLVGGANNRWGIGVTQQPDPASTFNVGGLSSTGTTIGLKINTFFSHVGSTNHQVYVQAATQDTTATYTHVNGSRILNASKGATNTHTRQSGLWIDNQTNGTYNANLIVSTSSGAFIAGNWDIYSESTYPSFFKSGEIRLLSATGPIIKSGTGSPESVVVAPVGSLYLRTDGGAGSTLYIKESGTSNTGWVGK